MRILLCGAGGVGKTTLVNEARETNRTIRGLPRIQEVARDVMRNKGLDQNDIKDIATFLNLQKCICREQTLREGSSERFLSDRSALDCVIYTWLKTSANRVITKDSEVVADLHKIVSEFKQSVPYLDQSIMNYRRSLIVLISPLPFCEDDGVRHHLTTEDSKKFTFGFEKLLTLLGIPYLQIITNDRHERVNVLCKAFAGQQMMKTCNLQFFSGLTEKKNVGKVVQAENSLNEVNYPFYLDKNNSNSGRAIPTINISDTEIKQSWTDQQQGQTNRFFNSLGEFSIDDLFLVEFAINVKSCLVHKVLLKGITIMGETYNFLGCSASGIKSRKCYLLRGSQQDVENILNFNGDFQAIKSVSKRLARISLLFSAVILTDLTVDNVQTVDDVENDRYNFTDGCGSISNDLITELFKRVKVKGQVYPLGWRPVVFQVRYQGYKGVLHENIDLRGRTIVVRPSMLKFKTTAHPFIGICDFSKPYSFGHLNRQYITLLSSLGIQNEIFLAKQRDHFESIRQMGKDPEAAISLLLWQNQLDTASILLRLKFQPSMKNSLQSVMRTELKQKIAKIQNQLVEKVDRLRIMIPKSRNIFGICDSENILEYGECFLRVTVDDRPHTIRGSVLVGKNPCYLLGDLRVLRAVDSADRPELSKLSHLVDCIIFPIRGKRPHSNEIAGSDLDGDCYFVTWDADLIPPYTKAPYDYPDAPSKPAGKITQENVIRYFSEQNQTSRLTGMVDSLFKKWSDIKGADSEECERLAQIFSRVIDAGKSGERVSIPKHLLNPPALSPQSNVIPRVWDIMLEQAAVFKGEVRQHILLGRESFFCCDQVSTNFIIDLLENPDKAGVTSQFDRFDFAWRHFTNLTNDTEEALNLLMKHLDYVNFALFSTDEKAIAIDRGIPLPIVLNAMNKSRLLTPKQLSAFQNGDCAFPWNFYFKSHHDDFDWSLLVKALSQNRNTLIVFKMPDEVMLVFQFNQTFSFGDKMDVNPGTITAFFFSQHFDYSKRYVLAADYKLDLTDRKLQLYRKVPTASFLWLKSSEEKVSKDEHENVSEVDSIRNAISVDLTRFQRDIFRRADRGVHPLVRKTPFVEVEVFVQNASLGYLDVVGTDFYFDPPELADQDEKEDGDLKELSIDIRSELSSQVHSADNLPTFMERLIRNRYKCTDPDIRELIQLCLLDFIDELSTKHIYYRIQLIVYLFRIGLKDVSTQLMESIKFSSLNIEEFFEILTNWMNWWFLDQETSTKIIDNFSEVFDVYELTDTINYIKHFGILQTLSLIEEMKSTKKVLESSKNAPGNIGGWKVDPISINENGNTDEDMYKNEKELEITFYRTTAIDFLSQLSKGQFVAITRQSDLLRFPSAASACCLGTIISARPSPPTITVSILDPINFPSLLEDCSKQSRKVFWRLSLVGNVTSFTRCMTALTKLSVDSPLATELTPLLVHPGGHLPTSPLYKNRPFSYPESKIERKKNLCLNFLNEAQQAAVEAALTDVLTLIQGPPGTGKTTVACEIVRLAHKQSNIGKILVCAETNLAVDNIARKILQKQNPELIILRIGNENHVAPDMYDISLDGQMRNIAAKEAKQVVHRDSKGTEHRNQGMVRQLINAATLVLTTCSGAGDPVLATHKFDLVVCDEATLTREASLLCALIHSAERLVLIGDPKQLGPFSMTNGKATQLYKFLPELAELNTTLFHRLHAVSNITTHLLTHQHRMHPALMQFPSEYFYEDKLVAGVTSDQRTPPPFCWPDPNRPLAFVGVSCGAGTERRRGTSFENTAEANLVLDCLERLLAPKEEETVERDRLTAVEVGVVTPYLGQVQSLRQLLKARFSRVEVSTIDGFQGREKEVIIVNTVRCNADKVLGFTDDLNRVNVMLTRARRGFILIGCKSTLSGSEVWRQWINMAPEISTDDLKIVQAGASRNGNRGRGSNVQKRPYFHRR